ncbi:histone-lysine N-methyltransferase SETMAR-like isoform X1 [Asterias rubens]|uniref:histone-lysine N-methyltransferase SETMAR-like isoform X1 n=2 Tax=Asterias rubens TaxID=7604 RepID=UPI0014554E0D|nr:histone-lysine N-methyltransferase SETMAR-like isoform X1 [Asterias rubens]
MDGQLLSTDNDKIVLPEGLQFKYSSINMPGPALESHPNEIIFDGCVCLQASCPPDCPCIQRFGANYNTKGQFLKGPGISQSQPIFECNSSCRCGQECVNRVVQNGVKHKLEVFQSNAGKGYGVRVSETIQKDCFICEYAGEILTLKEAKRRTLAMTADDMNFIMIVRECLADGKVIRTHIDPSATGNIGRFINHSCEPNLYQIVVRVDNDIPKVALFTRRPIEVDEELTYSYWGDQQPTSLLDGRTSDDGKMKPCLCGSDKCLGFLPFNESLYETESK